MKSQRQVRSVPQTIEELMGSRWWKGALRFLRDNAKTIKLAESPAVMGRGGEVILDGKGFKMCEKIATPTRKKPKTRHLRTSTEVLECLRSCDSASCQLPEKRIVEGIIQDLAEGALTWTPPA